MLIKMSIDSGLSVLVLQNIIEIINKHFLCRPFDNSARWNISVDFVFYVISITSYCLSTTTASLILSKTFIKRDVRHTGDWKHSLPR